MALINDDNSGGLVAGATDNNDVINGNGGDDIIIGLGGVDSLFGGSGSDTFDYQEAVQSECVPGEIIDGGTEVGTIDRIRIDGIVSFIGADIRSIEEIEFKPATAFSTHRADLTASQFGTGRIALNALIDASGGDNNEIRVIMGTATSFDASQLAFQDWSVFTNTFRITGDSSSETITLSSVKDTVNSAGGNDTLRNIRNTDQVNAGSGNDSLFVDGNMSGALLDGSFDADVLFAGSATDLRSADIRSIEQLAFDPATATSTTVQLLSSQFSSTGLSTSLLVTGRLNATDLLSVTAVAGQTTINANLWTFANFGDNGDRITLSGSTGNDTLTGTTFADTILGNDGADTLNGKGGADSISGGIGNDTIVIDTPIATGMVIDGGADTDTILLQTGVFQDLKKASLSSIERLQFADTTEPAGTFALIFATQFGTGLSNALEIIGAAGRNTVNIQADNGQPVVLDLSNVTFVNRGTEDAITVSGSASSDVMTGSLSTGTLLFASGGDDTLTGGNEADRLIGGAGLDTMSGGGGDDTFTMVAGDLLAGETYDGGAGLDTIATNAISPPYDFRAVTLNSIDRLRGEDADSSHWIFDSSQIGTGLSSNAEIIDEASGSLVLLKVLDIRMSTTTTLDLSAFQFLGNWSSGTGANDDKVRIIGSATNDTIVASNVADTINGANGDDTINGGGGGDIIFGGLGKDRMTGGSGDDQFRFISATESNSAATRDIITDFVSGEDVINLRVIDANEMLADDQAFILDTDGIVTAGEFRIRQTGAFQALEFNTDGDAIFEFQIQVNGIGNVTGVADFLL